MYVVEEEKGSLKKILFFIVTESTGSYPESPVTNHPFILEKFYNCEVLLGQNLNTTAQCYHLERNWIGNFFTFEATS